MKRINLTQGQKAIIDDDMYEMLRGIQWWATKKSNGFYGTCHLRLTHYDHYTTAKLHHYVVGKPLKGYVVDHINGNTLDNRRNNLRVVTISENLCNKKVHREGKIVGVGYQKQYNRWRAMKRIGGRSVHIGSFKTQEEASEAYKAFVQNSIRLNTL